MNTSYDFYTDKRGFVMGVELEIPEGEDPVEHIEADLECRAMDDWINDNVYGIYEGETILPPLPF